MFTNIKIVAGAVCAGLLFGAAALAEPKEQPAPSAPTTWAPPAEIAPKAAAEGAPAPAAAPSAAATPAPAASAKSKTDKQKDCRAQADAKGLHGKERKQFRADCEKQ